MYYNLFEEEIEGWSNDLDNEDKTPTKEQIRNFAEKLYKEARGMDYGELTELCYSAMKKQDWEDLMDNICNGIKERILDEFPDSLDEEDNE